jgi:RNA polymerase sigma factor (TIGR02999 family)
VTDGGHAAAAGPRGLVAKLVRGEPTSHVASVSAPSPPPDTRRVTRLLERLEAGDSEAVDQLFPLVYADLRRMAGAAMARESPGHTLQPTALVNEAWLKLARGGAPAASGREHFLAIAARAMRQVLVDHARRRAAERRGGGRVQVSLADVAGVGATAVDPEELLELDRALDELEAVDPRLRQVVEYRYFAGLTDAEIAGVLGVTRRTVLRDWVKARAWLNRALAGEAS